MNIFKGLLSLIFGNQSPAGKLTEIREERKERKIVHRKISLGGGGKYRWSLVGYKDVWANTRSEARARFKEQAHLLRLPIGARVRRRTDD